MKYEKRRKMTFGKLLRETMESRKKRVFLVPKKHRTADGKLQPFSQVHFSDGREHRKRVTPFFRRIVAVGGSPSGRRRRHIMERGVRANVATRNRSVVDGTHIGGALKNPLTPPSLSPRTVVVGSSLGFRLRPHNRHDPKPVAIAKPGTRKKSA